MPRHRRAHVPGALYHVTLRGAHRPEHYFALADRASLIELLRQMLERFAGKLHCYDNSPERLRLLVQVGEEPLGRMMLRVARRYLQCIHEHPDDGGVASLPEALDVVNRLFVMRVQAVAQTLVTAQRQQRPADGRGIAVEPQPHQLSAHNDVVRGAGESAR